MTHPFPKHRLHILISIFFLYLLVTALSTASVAQSNHVERIDYLKMLREQRTWAGLTSKTMRVGDVVWSYSEGGHKDRPTILLIHGLSSNRDTWNEIAHELTPYYHEIIPDLPSSGDTQVPANFDLSVPNVTEQLRRFIETANIQKQLNIAGHSIGGSIAMFYAAQYPYDTQSLLLISTGGLFKSNNTAYLKNPLYLKQLLVTQTGDLEFARKKIMYSLPFLPSAVAREQEKYMISQSESANKVIQQLVEFNKLYTADSFAKMAKNIEAPTMIIWGKQDQIVNVEVAKELQSMLKRGETPIILNQVGHVPILETPQLVVQGYLPFLQRTIQLKNPVAEP